MKTTHYILLLFLISSISPLFSTTYYVSNAGSNANDGLSPGNAFLTIQFATNLVVAGDSVLVADGTYAGFDHRGESGSASDPIVYLANGKDVFITTSGPLRADGINIEGTPGNELEYIEINGFNIIGIPNNGNGVRLVFADFCIVRNCNSDANYRGIFTGFTDNILIENNYCANSYGEHGIYLSNSSDDAIIRNNTCFNNINIGIHMNGDASAGEDGIIHKPILYGNIIYENKQAAGINMDGVLDALIFNNLIYNNHNASGITIFQDDGGIMSQAARIYHNTIVVPSDGRWGINMYNGAQFNTILKNNIIVNLHPQRGVLALYSTSGFESDYNILQNEISVNGDILNNFLAEDVWQDVYMQDNNSSFIDDEDISGLFENMAMGNFNLAMNSIAIDAGTDEIDDVVLTDILGGGRPAGGNYDIGAFERGAILAIDDVSDLWLNGLNESIAVSWKAKTENKITDFFVERSADGLSWENLAHVPFNQKKENYRVLDNQPFNGPNYYRIKSMDPNGEYFYSMIRSIEFEAVLKMRLFPNPGNGLILSDAHDDNLVMEVFDMLGRKVARKEGWSGYWDSGLSPGIYYFSWKSQGRNFVEKMVIE